MISREFIYEFSNFDDIKSRENNKKSCPHDICMNFDEDRCAEVEVWCRFNGAKEGDRDVLKIFGTECVPCRRNCVLLPLS